MWYAERAGGEESGIVNRGESQSGEVREGGEPFVWVEVEGEVRQVPGYGQDQRIGQDRTLVIHSRHPHRHPPSKTNPSLRPD
jgi:hypothetical protein